MQIYKITIIFHFVFLCTLLHLIFSRTPWNKFYYWKLFSHLNFILPYLKNKSEQKNPTRNKQNHSTLTLQLAFPSSYCYSYVSKVQLTFCGLQSYKYKRIHYCVSYFLLCHNPSLILVAWNHSYSLVPSSTGQQFGLSLLMSFIHGAALSWQVSQRLVSLEWFHRHHSHVW